MKNKCLVRPLRLGPTHDNGGQKSCPRPLPSAEPYHQTALLPTACHVDRSDNSVLDQHFPSDAGDRSTRILGVVGVNFSLDPY